MPGRKALEGQLSDKEKGPVSVHCSKLICRIVLSSAFHLRTVLHLRIVCAFACLFKRSQIVISRNKEQVLSEKTMKAHFGVTILTGFSEVCA